MTVAELLARISSEELTEWMAYEHVVGPLGPERADMLHGIQTAAIVNALRGKGRKSRPTDFIPKWDRGRETPWDEMLARVRVMNQALGGTDTTKTGGGGGGGTSRRAPRRDRRQNRRPDERHGRGRATD